MKKIKLNFQLVTILLVTSVILLVILISILVPNSVVPWTTLLQGTNSNNNLSGVPSEYNAPIQANTLIRNNNVSDVYYFNSDTIVVNGDSADYYYFNSKPDNTTLDFIKSQLGVKTINLLDSSYLDRQPFDVSNSLNVLQTPIPSHD